MVIFCLGLVIFPCFDWGCFVFHVGGQITTILVTTSLALGTEPSLMEWTRKGQYFQSLAQVLQPSFTLKHKANPKLRPCHPRVL